MRDSLQKIVSEFEFQTQAIKRQLSLLEYLVRGEPELDGLTLSRTQKRNMSVISRAMNFYITNEMKVVALNGSIIIVAAFFEEAIRSLIRDCLAMLSRQNRHFHNLSLSVQKSQINAFAARFHEMKDPTEFFQVESITQIENMLACARRAEGYVLLSAEISKNKNNLRSAELSELCNRIGLKGIWGKISERVEVQDYVGQYNPKFVLSECTNRLNAFIEARNALIHMSPSASSYGRDWIEAEMEFLVTVLNCAALVFDDHFK